MNTLQSPNANAHAESALLLFGPFALHRAGQLRTREQLEARVWPRSIVEETSLRVHMSALRRAPGDGRDGVRYVENIPGCGYSFVGTVARLAGLA